MLFVSLVCPHFPLIARPEWYNLYPEDKVPWPAITRRPSGRTIPYIQAMRACQIYDQGFDDRKRYARRSPPTSASSASSTTMSDGW